MIIRKAVQSDIDSVERIYSSIHSAEEEGSAVIGWKRGIYPEKETAGAALERGDLFVVEDLDSIVGTGIINKQQLDSYRKAKWNHDAPDESVMVMHTLVIDPGAGGKGYGKAFVKFYEDYALRNGCQYLRIDTNERNMAARKMYEKLGYTEVAVVPCTFNGLPDVQLVLLEKYLDQPDEDAPSKDWEK